MIYHSTCSFPSNLTCVSRLLTEAIFTSQGFSVHFAPLHSEVDRKTLAGEDAPRLKNTEYPTHWKKKPIYYHKSREIRK